MYTRKREREIMSTSVCVFDVFRKRDRKRVCVYVSVIFTERVRVRE